MNAVAEELTGWSLAAARGRPLAEVDRVEDAPADGRGAIDTDAHLIGRDGTRTPVEADSVALHDGAGVPLGTLHVLEDVGACRRAERELASALAREQELCRSALAASRVKDEFLTTLSHELRTPLNAILGWSHLMREPTFTPDERQNGLAAIERNARVQVALVDELLDLSRIISGKLSLEKRVVDLPAVINAALDAVRPFAHDKEIRLLRVVDTLVPRVLGDPTRLQQVLWNLLANAVKFTPRGGSVVLRALRVESHLEISVADTGIGIAPEFLPFVFERFRQAEEPTTRKHSGLGVGLSIVRHLVELHGGRVSAASAGPDLGATFTLSLPLPALVEAVRPEAGGARAAAAGPVLPAVRLDRLRVLVVDDELDARELVRHVLAVRGAQVETASSAAEAFAFLESFRPEVLISDIGMPREDGYAMMRRIRALPADSGGGVPSIALTAFARSEDRLRAILAGFQTHLPKPVEPAELLAVVAQLALRAS